MKQPKTRLIPRILANVGIVLGILYIVLFILDRFNPMLHFLSVVEYLDVVIAALLIAMGVIFIVDSWKRVNKAIRKKQERGE